MKRFIMGLAVGVLLTVTSVAAGEERPIKIILNGKELYSDVQPQIIDGRTFVPIRVISEALGINVKWDNINRNVILSSPENMQSFNVVSYEKIDNENGFVILGEVKNESQKTYGKVELKAEILDSNGNVTETLSTALPPGVTPGETAYFKLRSFSKNAMVNHVNFGFSTLEECSVTPTDVDFSDVRFSRDQNIYSDFIYVNGEIERNDKDFSRDYKHPVIQIVLLDENGKIINFGEKNIDDFEMNRYSNFKITLENGSPYSSYKLKFFSD